MGSKRSRHRKNRHSSRRRGYVLITTLLIIAMACILTAGIANRSMSLAVASVEIETDLQNRWGAISCQRVAFAQGLRRTPGSSSENSAARDLATSSCTIVLNDHTFSVRVDDESSKLDVNTLYQNSTAKNTAVVIKKLKRDSALKVALSPLQSNRRRKATEDAFEAWGQVFQYNGQPEEFPLALRESSQNLTCWSHRLNYQSCSDEALFESAKPIAGAITAEKLVRNRRNGIASSELAIEQTQAVGDKQMRLKELLSDSSSSKSVWITSIFKTRYRHLLTIRESVTGSISRYYSWSW